MFRAKVCHMISVKGSGGSQDKKNEILAIKKFRQGTETFA